MPDIENSESLSGVLEKIVYYNEENHYLIGQLKGGDDNKDTITITGKLPEVQCGETLELKGSWTNHPKFGTQFQVTSFRSTLPASVYGIRKYLGSGLIPGIGKTYANKIVDHFGEATLDVISNYSKRLREVPGIGRERAASIKNAWDEQQIYREVMIFLQTHNVSNSQCIRLVKKYGARTIQTLREDPYVLIRDIDGIGFLTADKIAHNLGIPSNSDTRINAGLYHTLKEAGEEGHTCLPSESLLNKTQELLKLESDEIKTSLDALLASRELIRVEEQFVQLPQHERSERRIAESLWGINQHASSLPPIKKDLAVEWFEEKAGFQLAESQSQAILEGLSHKVSIITGGPGTGKTTLLKGLVSILKAKKVKVLLASPTGRAAKRLAQATGGYAQTVHRMLGYDPAKGGFLNNENSPLNAEYVIVDEASMLDSYLASALFAAIPYQAHLLLVGDSDQLPSVGAGNVLADLIACKLFRVTRLEFVYRQSKGSEISTIAHSVLKGAVKTGEIINQPDQVPDGAEFVFIKTPDPETLPDTLTHLVKNILPQRLPPDWLSDLQVLAPLHRGTAGTQNLNQVMQAALNPRKDKISAGYQEFRTGDRVIQIRNNYDKNVFNGDVGQISELDTEKGVLSVDFEGRIIEYKKSELYELQLAYTISIHKSQGSEYPVVIIPLLKQHFIMLERNLVYTGITRGKKCVILIGQVEAFAMAVRNRKTQLRYTQLVSRLEEKIQSA